MNLAELISNDEILNMIKNNFDNEIYVVGGIVRDWLLKKTNLDRDLIICDEDARTFALKLSNFFEATFVPLDEMNKIYRVVFPDKVNYLDITNPVGDSLSTDLARRDLSINAIAVNLKTNEIIDPCKGLCDLKNGCLRQISEQNFIDDPLRLLRVFRFQSVLGFNITPDLMHTIEKYRDLIVHPAKERIVYEIMKLFSGDYSHEAILAMDECGILAGIFPFVEELKQIPPNAHHHLDLFNHSVETVRQITEIYNYSDADVKNHLQKIDFGGFSRIAHLRLAGFLHDIGKYSTWSIEEGRHRFIKHDDVGAKLASSFLKKMCFSNKQINYIQQMIKYHIYPSHVMSSLDVTEKIMMRFVRRMDENSIDNIILAMADRLSARGPEITDDIVSKNISALERLLQFYITNKDFLTPLPKLLDGNEIMQLLNLKPSPKLGFIIKALEEAQLSGDIVSKEQAIDFIKQIYSSNFED